MSSLARKSTAQPRFDSAEQEAYLNLWRTYDRLRAIEDEFFSGYGLTAQQYNSLRLLHAAWPETLPTLAIADKLISRAPDITRLLDRLESRGLVVRQRLEQNRRVVRVGITKAGMDLLEEMVEPLRECHQRQLGHLSARQLEQLTKMMRSARDPHEEPGTIWK